MLGDTPHLADIWPYEEIAVSPQLAALPLEAFFAGPPPAGVTAGDWRAVEDAEAAPRASYALRLTRRDGEGTLAKWEEHNGRWRHVASFPLKGAGAAAVIIDLNGIVLGNVDGQEALKTRIISLTQSELGQMTRFRLSAMVFSLTSIITLFFSVRIGIETRAAEPFALIFFLAVAAGMTAATLKTRAKAVGERALDRVRQQFQHEFRTADHQGLSLAQVNAILRMQELKREETAVVIGFLLMLCFVYFVSPLMVVAVIFSVFLVTLISGDAAALRGLALAYDRAEQRLEQALLSYRASNDRLSTPALRRAKKQVLRDRLRRHANVRALVQKSQGRRQLSQDLAQAVAFLVIFGTYAMLIVTGLEQLSPGLGSSLASTSLFSVAPVIILISISRTTLSVARVAGRQLALLSR